MNFKSSKDKQTLKNHDQKKIDWRPTTPNLGKNAMIADTRSFPQNTDWGQYLCGILMSDKIFFFRNIFS